MSNNARLGIAGEVRGRSMAGAEAAGFGVSGLSTRKNIQSAAVGITGNPVRAGRKAAVGAAGLDRPGVANTARLAAAGTNTRQVTAASLSALRHREDELAGLSADSQRLGDRAARDAWGRGVWFADFTYLVTPYEETANGGYRPSDRMNWRNGRNLVFAPECRALPLFVDSCGYRRELTGTAPQWAMDFDTYPAALELLRPEGYAAWDYPKDRQRTLEHLRRLMAIFPHDVADRMWPVFSIRWTWQEKAHLGFSRLPGWAGRQLAPLIPLNRTQRQFKESTRERWARQAIANALAMAQDRDFRWMVETFGRVMIGGMVGCDCPRMARHIFAAVLSELFPEAQFWLLGQANFATVNGLGMLGLLDQVWTDGTWWILDATCERFAYVEDGLITLHSFENDDRATNNGKRTKRRETFFTLTEMMAANLRSLLAAYEGLWSWPPPEPLPVDLLDVGQAIELKSRYQAAQMELGL